MRDVKFTKQFTGNGITFSAYYEATKWLLHNGYSWGSSDTGPYIPIVKGEYDIPQKWYNLSKTDIENLAGVIHSLDYRDGLVEVRLFDNPELIGKEEENG